MSKTAQASFAEGMAKDEAELESLEAEQRQDKRELAMYKNKDDMLAEFNKALKLLSLNRKAAKTKFDQATAAANTTTFKKTLQMEIKAALENLPFNERKRILDTVFNREAGGKIFIRPVTGWDLVDDPENHSRKVLNKPIKGEYQYEMDFKLDLNRIIALINSLNNIDLLIEDAYCHLRQGILVTVIVAEHTVYRDAGVIQLLQHKRRDKVPAMNEKSGLAFFDNLHRLAQVPDVIMAVTHDGYYHRFLPSIENKLIR